MAKTGFLPRRAFLQSGATLLTAVAATPAVANIDKAQLQASMFVLGQRDVPYGTPSQHESHIGRNVGAPQPLTTINSSYTPIANQRGIITPSGVHYGVHHSGIPDIDPAEHVLYIHGMTEQALKFSIEDLMRYPMQGAIHFLECAGNTWQQAAIPDPQDIACQDLYGLLSGSEWFGVPVKYLLEQAVVKPKGKWVIAEGADAHSMTRSIPIEKLMDNAIVALYQNGERLRPQQGYPMRLFLPGFEGNTNVKWLRRLEVVDQPAYTKDESREYTETLSDGSIEGFSLMMGVKSVITHPSAGQALPDKGFYEVSGLAWSGHGKIKGVEVSDDGGKTWQNAELQGPVLPYALTRFALPWKWKGNPARLVSRALDEKGNHQPTHKEWGKRYMPGSYNHYNAMQTWEINSEGGIRNVV